MNLMHYLIYYFVPRSEKTGLWGFYLGTTQSEDD